MTNTENLIPLDERTKKEQREIAKKGGMASGMARRRKRELKELLELALSQPSGAEEGEDNYTAICVALINEAKKGNKGAFETIRDTIGQKPVEKVEGDITAKIEVDYGE